MPEIPKCLNAMVARIPGCKGGAGVFARMPPVQMQTCHRANETIRRRLAD